MSLFVWFGMKRLCFGHIIYPLLTRKFVRSRRLSIGVVFSLYDFVLVHKKIQTCCLHAWSLTYMSYISLLPCRELRKDEDYFYVSVLGRCPLQCGHSNRHTWKKIVQSQRFYCKRNNTFVNLRAVFWLDNLLPSVPVWVFALGKRDLTFNLRSPCRSFPAPLNFAFLSCPLVSVLVRPADAFSAMSFSGWKSYGLRCCAACHLIWETVFIKTAPNYFALPARKKSWKDRLE